MTLTMLLGSSARLDAVAADSYVHANGFTKVVLRSGVRLHIWETGHRRHGQESDPHGHRWDFASWVIAGTLRETVFRSGSSHGQRFTLREYSREAGRTVLRSRGEARLEARETKQWGSGSVYKRSRSELHMVEAAGEALVASLVLQGIRVQRSAPVYLLNGTDRAHGEHPLGRDVLTALLAEVLAAMR